MASTMTLALQVLPIFLVLGIALFVTRAQETDNCDRYDVDGCSIPFGLPFFFKGLFTHSCNRHDICYHCGVAYKITRVTCDSSFKRDMKTACRNKYRSLGYATANIDQRNAYADGHETRVLNALMEYDPEFLAILEKELPMVHLLLLFNEVSAELFDLHKEKIIGQWAVVLANLINQGYLSDDPAYNIVSQNTLEARASPHLREDHSSNGASREKNRVHSLEIFQERQVLEQEFFTSSNDGSYVKETLLNVIPVDSPDDKMFCDRIIDFVDRVTDTEPVREKLNCRDVELLACYFFAEVYYLAVRFFAGSSYHPVPEFYCQEGFVPSCLPPTSM